MHSFADVKIILLNLLVLVTCVIYCDKKMLYHELSKELLKAGSTLPKDALFGYSITHQKMRKKIIISAPRASIQGEVFECDTTSNHTCSKINIEIDLIPIEAGVEPHTHSWLGATVCAGSNFFLTCAPCIYIMEKQYGWHGTTSRCFYQSADSGIVDSKNPIQLNVKNKIESNQYFFKDPRVYKSWEKKFDTMGWSMDVSSDDVTIVGGPGGSTGRAMLIPKRKTHGMQLQLIHVKRNNSDPDALVLYEFGYSVKAGKFLGTEVYAVSSPYGAMGQGKVLFYSKDGEYMQAIVDDDIGALFGGALCGAQLGAGTGDEALLVGAPTSAGASDQFDVGAVHVYLNEAGKMVRKRTIRGYINNGYFGYALTTVGDLNLDGKDEVVISAPYENEYRGAVYIFSGADLVKSETTPIQWLQRIEGDAPAQMLGLALSPVQDTDGNGCNELSVGLPGNNSALLMKCMNFVTFTIDLEERSKRIEEMNYTSVFMKMCINFTYNGNLKEIENFSVTRLFAEKLRSGKAEFQTELTCMIAGEKRIKKTTTTMHLLLITVPMWILLVAVAIGLLALLIMAFVLYECGFLRRKHKEELTALKKDVNRQSIRRSMRLRESMIQESRHLLRQSHSEAQETDSGATAHATEPVLADHSEHSGSRSRRVVADIH